MDDAARQARFDRRSQAQMEQQDDAAQLATAVYERGKEVAGVVYKEDVELWGLITKVEKLSPVKAWICAILNLPLAGLGTMIAACLGQESLNKTQLVVGLLQLMTSVYLIGWFFSIYWSYLLVKTSMADNAEVQRFIEQTQVRSD